MIIKVSIQADEEQAERLLEAFESLVDSLGAIINNTVEYSNVHTSGNHSGPVQGPEAE
jgi:hypothetical protein